MSENLAKLLPDLRRIVTGHDNNGISSIESDRNLTSESMSLVNGARSAAIWVTTDSLPTNDNNNPSVFIVQADASTDWVFHHSEDGAARIVDDSTNFGLVHPIGTNLRSTELAPGATTPMHRTSSLDYNILVEGELILITEDGIETHLRNPGDTVVQKGTMHAWRNPGANWTSLGASFHSRMKWKTEYNGPRPGVKNWFKRAKSM